MWTSSGNVPCTDFIIQDTLQEGMDGRAGWPKMAIFIHLHYLESLGHYLSKIDRFAALCHIYISTDSLEVYQILRKYAKRGRREITVCRKPNRGRDVSALLVAFREEAMKHEIICFLHDKKWKKPHLKEETDFWAHHLWNNLVCSEGYVAQIISLFCENPDLGLLFPPEPIGRFAEYDQFWESNAENTIKLARNLGLAVAIKHDEPPYTYGTMFWGRTAFLQKLLRKDWEYTDFDEEPLPDDGTLSHAVERILGYVVADAGGTIGRAMTYGYAQKYMGFLREAYRAAFQFIDQEYGLKKLNDVLNYNEREGRLIEFCEKNPHIYLYGAGEVGKQCFKMMARHGLSPDGFVVTNPPPQPELYMGQPVIGLCQTPKNVGIIITVSYDLIGEIENSLQNAGIHNYMAFYRK